ncbi:hypothetical protein, partial [Salibaculum halophilum]|uniref:hypothetical protein n=1 Tax=Salibaculum halophilum TaxID=1914408 RepID=UPI0015C46078
RRDPDVVAALETMPGEGDDAETSRATDEAVAIPFAVALARLAIVEWEGVGDAKGNPVEPGPETIPALMDIWPIFEAFQTRYVQKGLLLEQEKNVSAPSQPGSGAGARSTAQGAKGRARTARKRKSGR